MVRYLVCVFDKLFVNNPRHAIMRRIQFDSLASQSQYREWNGNLRVTNMPSTSPHKPRMPCRLYHDEKLWW